MLVDFYDSVNGRAIRGMDALENALMDYTDTSHLALIQKEVRSLFQQAIKNNGGEFTPYFKIEFNEVNNGSHYILRLEKRIGSFHENQGHIHITYVDSVVKLRYEAAKTTVRNAGWDIRGLKLALAERIRSFEASKRELIRNTLSEFGSLDKQNPTEFAFDIDDDDERLSIVALRNHKPYATTSFYR